MRIVEPSTPQQPRLFAAWAADQIEIVCARNDVDRPGKEIKEAWETTPPHILREKITEEFAEVFHAFLGFDFSDTEENRKKLQWELADLAAAAMMLSSRVDPEISKLRRGR